MDTNQGVVDNKAHWLREEVTHEYWNCRLRVAFQQLVPLSEWAIVGYLEPPIFNRKETHVRHFAQRRSAFNPRTRSSLKDAEQWIFEDDHEWPYSFINICEAVDMIRSIS